MQRIVVDTNVFIGALKSRGGANRAILEGCFMNMYQPVITDSLFFEYESVMNRFELMDNCLLNEDERDRFLDDFCSLCQWVDIHYRWRPNLRDEGDNHVLELAVAAGAGSLVTWNIKDYRRGDLDFPVMIATPPEFLKTQRALAIGRTTWPL